MAFRTATKPTAVPSQDNWKADAFINLSIPTERPDGTDGALKLEAIKLYANKDQHELLIEMFRKDPVDAANRLRAALVIDYREANASQGTKLKI